MKYLFLFLGLAALILLLKMWVTIPNPVRPNATDDETDHQGERGHIEGEGCWCHPTLFFDGGKEFGDVWVHKAPGDDLPPAWVLAQAIADAVKGD